MRPVKTGDVYILRWRALGSVRELGAVIKAGDVILVLNMTTLPCSPRRCTVINTFTGIVIDNAYTMDLENLPEGHLLGNIYDG